MACGGYESRPLDDFFTPLTDDNGGIKSTGEQERRPNTIQIIATNWHVQLFTKAELLGNIFTNSITSDKQLVLSDQVDNAKRKEN